ncbi:MAG: sulfotransferase [Phycisphaerales bacterium]|nr:sulfotransferase [Phycisphaerales bacterium]
MSSTTGVEIQSAAAKIDPLGEVRPRIPLVYIASPSFSGSTLLTFLLGAHPRVSTMGELRWADMDLATYRCSCGDLLNDCSYWKQVEQRVAARGLPFSVKRPQTTFRFRSAPLTDRVARSGVRGRVFELVRDVLLRILPASRNGWRMVRDVNYATMEAMIALRGGGVFVDASKEPTRLKHLADTGDYDIRVVHLIRDGRGVTNSGIQNKRLDVRTSIREWYETHRQIERLRGRFDAARWFQLRYEDLCAAPQSRMTELFQFIGLEPIALTSELDVTKFHVLGNRMRLEFSGHIALDEKWRTALSPAALDEFERVAGGLNREYGYA